MSDPNERCEKCMSKYYKNLCDDLFEYIFYKLSEEDLIKYLMTRGYKPQQDLINTLMFDSEFVQLIENELMKEYHGEGL